MAGALPDDSNPWSAAQRLIGALPGAFGSAARDFGQAAGDVGREGVAREANFLAGRDESGRDIISRPLIDSEGGRLAPLASFIMSNIPNPTVGFERPAEGVLGMFVGPKAATADQVALERARAFLKSQPLTDETNELARQQYGWFHGALPGVADREALREAETFPGLRTEISDHASAVNPAGLSDLQSGHPVPLGRLLSHPDLYSAYPALRNMGVTAERNPDYSGSFTPLAAPGGPMRGVIHVQPDLPDLHETLIHEGQHAIQQHEGWMGAVSPTDLLPSEYRKPGMEVPDDLYELALDRYATSPGELEAFTAQGRLNMTPEQRLANQPYHDEWPNDPLYEMHPYNTPYHPNELNWFDKPVTLEQYQDYLARGGA